MPFDGIVTSSVVCELNNKLIGGKIEKIYQPEQDEIILHIHSGKSSHRLLISSGSSHARLHVTNAPKSNPQNPMAFCMLLRKHLMNGRIQSIQQMDSERIVEICFDTQNEMGYSVSKKLIVEIMGKHSNIILVDNTAGKIIDSIKRISIDVNRYRQLLPGLLYVCPPDQGKTSIFSIDRDTFYSFFNVEAAEAYEPDITAKILLSRIQGISPALAADFAARTSSVEALFDMLKDRILQIKQCLFTPCVYLDHDDEPADFHCFQLLEPSSYYREMIFKDMSEAVEYYYDHKTSSNKMKQKSSDLVRALETGLDKLHLKKQKLSEDLIEAGRADHYRLFGELITANLHTIAAKQTETEVLNYYTGEAVRIPLDERLSASRNAQRYFKKYTKAKTAVIEKKCQLEEADSDIKYLESVLTHIENASAYEDIEDIRQELVDGGYLRRKSSSSKASKPKPAPICRVSSDGFRILIGRNNRENDILTFKTASPKDIWLHTKDIPGSHVVIISDGRQIPETTLLEAASVAAYYSKGRQSENVPVDYTLIRHVKKPAGAKPGMVIFVNNKTIYVTPLDLQRCK